MPRLLLAVLLLAGAHSAQSLVRDFNTELAGSVDSNPQHYASLPSGDVVFGAASVETGGELWISDGTEAGTQLLLDAPPGPLGLDPMGLVALPSGLILFTGYDGVHDRELWRTDGTAAGTQRVSDIRPGPEGSSISKLTLVGSEVFFFADDGVSGCEPWKSDGTSVGTTQIVDLVPGPQSSLPVFVSEYFTQLDTTSALFAVSPPGGASPVGGPPGLWRTDGTAAGTTFVSSIALGISKRFLGHLTGSPNLVFFRQPGIMNGYALWRTDGTSAGTFSLPIEITGYVYQLGSNVYFGGRPSSGEYELWRTDGSVSGTTQVVDITPPSLDHQNDAPEVVGTLGNQLVFSAVEDVQGRDLYITDGTASGTIQIAQVESNGTLLNSSNATAGGVLFFEGYDATSYGLWRTDGTTQGTIFLAALNLVGERIISMGSTVLFTGDTDSNGVEPWISDGTPMGTHLLRNIGSDTGTADAKLSILGKHGDLGLVSADDGVQGHELWTSDGTPAGTQLLVDANPGAGSSYVGPVASTGEQLIFSTWPRGSTSAAGTTWISDGTPSGTSPVVLAAGLEVLRAVPLGRKFILSARTPSLGAEIWVTDGTAAGTLLLADIQPGPEGSDPGFFFVWNDRAYVLADTPLVGREPWSTDGTIAGTWLLADCSAGNSDTSHDEFGGLGEFVYIGSDGNDGLWKSDGTPAGTAPFVDLAPGPGVTRTEDFLQLGSRLLFRSEAGFGTQVRWAITDGTGAGTEFLSGLLDKAGSAARIGPERALLTTERADGDADFWVLDDGQVSYLTTTSSFANFGLSTSITDDATAVPYYGPDLEFDLWRMDGTVAGTRRLFDLGPGRDNPDQLTRIGDKVLFRAERFDVGRELFVFPLAGMVDETVETFGFGCAGTGGIVPRIGVNGEADASATAPFELVVSDALPGAPTFLAYSMTPTASPVVDCVVWVGGNVEILLGNTASDGTATFPVLPSPSLAGRRFVAQAFILDPQGTALGLASATPGLEVVLGP